MRAVIQIPGETEVEQTCDIDGQDFEAEGVLSNGSEAQFVCCRDLIVLMMSLGLDA